MNAYARKLREMDVEDRWELMRRVLVGGDPDKIDRLHEAHMEAVGDDAFAERLPILGEFAGGDPARARAEDFVDRTFRDDLDHGD